MFVYSYSWCFRTNPRLVRTARITPYIIGKDDPDVVRIVYVYASLARGVASRVAPTYARTIRRPAHMYTSVAKNSLLARFGKKFPRRYSISRRLSLSLSLTRL